MVDCRKQWPEAIAMLNGVACVARTKHSFCLIKTRHHWCNPMCSQSVQPLLLHAASSPPSCSRMALHRRYAGISLVCSEFNMCYDSEAVSWSSGCPPASLPTTPVPALTAAAPPRSAAGAGRTGCAPSSSAPALCTGQTREVAGGRGLAPPRDQQVAAGGCRPALNPQSARGWCCPRAAPSCRTKRGGREQGWAAC